MVEGVASLVAGSVESLTKENVTVLDDTGKLLSAWDDEMATTGLTSRQLKIQQDFEQYLEDKAYELVEPVVGRGNVTVRVAASLDFDQIGRTVESFDLDQQTTVREDRSEIVPGTAEQGASSLTTNNIYETPRTVETYARIGSRVERLTVAVVVNDRVEGEGDAAESVPRTPQELTRLESLVRSGLGVSPQRGDAITVVSLPFDREPPAPPEEDGGLDILALVQAGIRPAIGLLGLTLAFVFGLKLLGFIKTAPVPQASMESLPAGSEGGGQAFPTPPGEMGASGSPQVVRPAQGAKVQLADPAVTARVVKAWMNES